MNKEKAKVVVFGGAGFLGSHVCDVLSELSYEVTIFDKERSTYKPTSIKFIQGDILDEKLVGDVIKDKEYVFNFAGFADLDLATTRPLDTIRQNILGNTILLKYAHKYGCKRFVYASTIYVYSSVGGFYRCSKQAAELYLEEYQQKIWFEFYNSKVWNIIWPKIQQI